VNESHQQAAGSQQQNSTREKMRADFFREQNLTNLKSALNLFIGSKPVTDGWQTVRSSVDKEILSSSRNYE
jgi:hypothetical protein